MLGLILALATAAMTAVCVIASWTSKTDEAADLVIGAAAVSLSAFATVVASDLTGISFSRFPGFDLVALVLFWSSHRAAPTQWKADVSFLLVGVLGDHAWFWAVSDQGEAAGWTYVLLKNILFGLQVAVLLVAGSATIVSASRDRRSLFRRRPRSDLARLP